MLNNMKCTKKTAGETAQAQTKPGWGFVAVIGFVMVCTMAESLILAGIGTVLFGLGAYLGGYMEETSQKVRNNIASPAEVGERSAA